MVGGLVEHEEVGWLQQHSRQREARELPAGEDADEYQGTYAIVSHNRSFLDPIVTKVLEFSIGKPPKFYYGNVSDYIEKKNADLAAAGPAAPAQKQVAAKDAAPKNRKDQRRIESQKRQERSKHLKPLKEKLEAV